VVKAMDFHEANYDFIPARVTVVLVPETAYGQTNLIITSPYYSLAHPSPQREMHKVSTFLYKNEIFQKSLCNLYILCSA